MKHQETPRHWRDSLARIGIFASLTMLLPAPLILGNPAWWVVISAIPLLLPIIFGRMKHRLWGFGLLCFCAAFAAIGIQRENAMRLRIREMYQKTESVP